MFWLRHGPITTSNFGLISTYNECRTRQHIYALLLSLILTAAVLVGLTSFSHRSQSLDASVAIMQDLVYFQARNIGTGWSAGDTIPFEPALSLSLITLAACVARLGGCYLPTERRWLQQGICCISTVLSLCLVGVVSSKAYSMYLLPG
jgi:hypothetical protein